MTPAEELTAAADKLDVLVSLVPAGPWGAEERSVEALGGESAWQRDVVFVGDDGEGGTSTPRVAEYIAAMNPLVGKALAELLRMEFVRIDATEKVHPPYVPDSDVMAIARLIIGSES